ncbi:MAG: Rieske 2Fe-2S domain-containing protein [Pigmentiphaga sp.]|uniref:Rieske 2Fe-2S domain-containing protein n=1 Tax=Pigmentiphaga sp. TaxID=1977564 RepID=UPI0029B1353A|nr:Rieske 2Fe-2S domain-containing protein [Pigmentiphaga sp.]MDX3906262.1 Rieske 2Fe-2S domain-containing protein [Pigmentiphaga sp.]
MGDETVVKELASLIPEGLPSGLRNYWYPILQSEELPADRPVGIKVLDENLAVWRDGAGNPNVVRDRCPHRSIRLSVGRVLDGDLQCLMHGLRFNGEGRCTLIPWEPSHTRHHDQLAVTAYPARELGGYIWAYLGDATRFPPPPLETQVPEELLKPDEFICFRLPTEIWNANWLLAIDGSDGFHAVVLHTDSQAVHRAERKAGDTETPLEDRRIKIIKTTHGIRGVSVDLEGNSLNHGHFTVDVKGQRFCLPCLTTNPIMPAPGAAPYASRLWQFPQDEKHTMVVRYLAWRASTPAERAEATRLFNEVAIARLKQVSDEDAMAAEAQGDLIEARSREYLLGPDEDVVKVRRLLRTAFVTQITERSRIDNPAGALDYPV